MVSHKTWQLLNSFECRFTFTVLWYLRLFAVYYIKKLVHKWILHWNQFYFYMTPIWYFFLVSIKLTNYGRRHFNLFTNCHVSWDTLYVWHLQYAVFRVGTFIRLQPWVNKGQFRKCQNKGSFCSGANVYICITIC